MQRATFQMSIDNDPRILAEALLSRLPPAQPVRLPPVRCAPRLWLASSDTRPARLQACPAADHSTAVWPSLPRSL